MSRIVIGITNDIAYDRRIQRIVSALSADHEVIVISRKLHSGSTESQIKCLFNNGFLFYFEFNLRLLLRLLSIRTDIMVAVDYDTLVPIRLASLIRRKKAFFDAHELFEESIEIQGRPFVKHFWSLLGRICVPGVNRAYTVSNSIAKYYTKLHGKSFSVIRNLPDLPEIDHKVEVSDKIILYQGVLNEGRMLELLVKLPAYLPPEFKVLIVGEGDKSQELREMADDKTEFISWINPDKLSTFTQKAFLGYNLLASDSVSYYYSLANKFFDYMHVGAPSLNSPFPEYEYYNDRYNCCYTRKVETVQELADWVEEIDRTKSEWLEKRKNSFIAATELNWSREQLKLLEIYDLDRRTDI